MRDRRESPASRADGRKSRRGFLQAAVGASLPLVVGGVRSAESARPLSAQVDNEFLAAAFDTTTGRLAAWRKEGGTWLDAAVARAHGPAGMRSTHEAAYRRTLESRRVQDVLGEGREVLMRCVDAERRLDIDLRATVYAGRAALFVDVECRNASRRPIVLPSIEPLCAHPETGGALHWPGITKVLTNGAMYYDPGTVTELPSSAESLRSWWNMGFFRGYDREGLVCGHLENQNGLGHVVATRVDAERIGLRAEAVLAKGFELAPGRSIRSGRFVVQLARDPYGALEAYAEAMGRWLGARTGSLVNGWCNWFYTFEHVSEEEILRNAEHAARTLRPFGLEFVQVDEGYQRWHGEWEGNERFPHGMKWLAERVRALGLRPGLWIAPYVVSEPTAVFRQHPEWLLRHPGGELKRVGPWPSEDSDWARHEKPKRYGLDVTHPGAAAWLADLFDTVAHRWGYEMVKIDFVDWSLLSAHRYHDPSVSRAQAYRRGGEIMRRALGPAVHLQDCGPGPVTVGLLDSMRIELDQNYGTRKNAWKQYVASPTSSAAAAAKRYYFHKRTWTNDADHACLSLLSLPQAQAAVTVLALSGGNLISGDRLTDLDPTRFEILKKALPAYGEAARPVDLFDTDVPCAFALPVRRPFGDWTVAAFVNADEADSLPRRYPLDRLGLTAAKTYIAYDFWGERFHGEVTGELSVTVPPVSVLLLALHEKRGVPQVLSTDRHVLQGALELEDFHWIPGEERIVGVSLGPRGTAHNVAVFLPQAHPWTQGGAFLHRDHAGYTAKMMDEHVLQVRVRFEEKGRVRWQIDLRDLFGR